MPAKIGIYAGTFDPVHVGHVQFALAAAGQCQLDTVVFIAEPQPRAKPHVTPLEHREAMLRLALADYPLCTVVQLPQRQFTVQQTLPALQDLFGSDIELYLLVGSDVVGTIAGWPDVVALLAQVQLVVGLRQSDTEQHVQQTLHNLEQIAGVPVRARILSTEHASVSSQTVRSSHLHGGWHPAVAAYSKEHRLYDRGPDAPGKLRDAGQPQ